MCDGLYRRVLELNPRHAVIGGVLHPPVRESGAGIGEGAF